MRAPQAMIRAQAPCFIKDEGPVDAARNCSHSRDKQNPSANAAPNSARPRIFDGAAEAKLIALTCSPAPEGFARWSLRLLEEKVVELSIVDKASDNTIGRTLKKTNSSRTAIGNG